MDMEAKPIQISSYDELIKQINELKEERSLQEVELKESFHRFTDSLNLLTRLKESIHKLATDSDLYVDLAKAGLNMSLRFVLNRLSTKKQAGNSFLGSALIDNLSAWIVNGNLTQIFAAIRNHFHPVAETETEDEQ